MSGVADITEEVVFYFRASLEERFREINRKAAREGWPEVITSRDDAIIVKLKGPAHIDYCMNTYFVYSLRSGTDPKNRNNWEHKFCLPMCVVERIEHQGKPYSPPHTLWS